MHLVFMTRGILGDVNEFVNELNAQYLPTTVFNHDKNEFEERYLQVRLAPVQLWDLSFPAEHKDIILNTILQGNSGNPQNSYMKKFAWGARKAMKLLDVPEYSKDKVMIMQSPKNTEIIALGMKEDLWRDKDGNYVKTEEKQPDKKYAEGI